MRYKCNFASFKRGQMPKRPLKFLMHIIGIVALLLIPFLLSPGSEISFSRLKNPHCVLDLISITLMIGFYYLNYFFLLDKFYFTRKIGIYFSICLSIFILSVIVPRILLNSSFEKYEMNRERHREQNELSGNPQSQMSDSLFIAHGHEERKSRHHRGIFFTAGGEHFFFDISRNIFLFIIITFFSLTMKINQRWRKAEKDKLGAELSYLKAQINPHFLFNTLNSIYSLALEKSDYTATAVVKLSGLMRYVITDASKDFVPLEKEINYIRDYVDLQKIRIGDTAEVQFNIEGDYQSKKIYPLLLMAFIENAFKYGVNPETFAKIVILITITESQLKLVVENKKVNPSVLEDESSKVGLDNTINRLKLIYASRYVLKVNDQPNDYKVELTIELI